ncbi:MAG: hypothetical protein GXX99_02015 [Clostridiales bacterium]|nr:hypothetical protein [Clostridiales bacterium]
MTPKELMYLEDAMGMEQQLQTKCTDYAEKMQDPKLKNLLSQLAQDHQKRYNNLLNQLN